MNAIRRVVLGSCAALSVAASLPVPAQDVKVGVFDAQTVSENTEMGKQIQARLTAFTEEKEAEIGARQERLKELNQQLARQSLSLSADKRAALEKDIQRHRLELQTFQEAATRELDLEYASATKEFQEKLIVTVETFGEDEGFTIILDRSQVAWATPAVDVTTAIVDRFNRIFPVTEDEEE